MWSFNFLNSQSSLVLITQLRNSCYRACIGKNKRSIYARMYPVTLIRPDGSAIRISYPEPIAVIRLPFDLNELSEFDRKRRLLKRQMSNKGDSKRITENQAIFQKDLNFDPKKYLNISKTNN